MTPFLLKNQQGELEDGVSIQWHMPLYNVDRGIYPKRIGCTYVIKSHIHFGRFLRLMRATLEHSRLSTGPDEHIHYESANYF